MLPATARLEAARPASDLLCRYSGGKTNESGQLIQHLRIALAHKA